MNARSKEDGEDRSGSLPVEGIQSGGGGGGGTGAGASESIGSEDLEKAIGGKEGRDGEGGGRGGDKGVEGKGEGGGDVSKTHPASPEFGGGKGAGQKGPENSRSGEEVKGKARL